MKIATNELGKIANRRRCIGSNSGKVTGGGGGGITGLLRKLRKRKNSPQQGSLPLAGTKTWAAGQRGSL